MTLWWKLPEIMNSVLHTGHKSTTYDASGSGRGWLLSASEYFVCWFTQTDQLYIIWVSSTSSYSKFVFCYTVFEIIWTVDLGSTNCTGGQYRGCAVFMVYCELMNLIKFCTCGKRWLTSDFLSMALWVIFDQEEALTHRVRYGPH